MSNEPLNTEVIEQRLRDELAHIENFQVGGAADYAAVKDLGSFRCPSAFVVPTRESATNDEARHTYQVTAGFGVVVAVRHYGSVSGTKAIAEARPLIGAIRTALVGWMPQNREFRECLWLEGDVLDYDAGTLLWADAFKTKFFINRS
ncbi:hypothetical protein [uncultured Gilvimarinus sp.]|uniref:phage tail terminator protein n=1 Tax=uncultured Gilvimarinus sp. TaxID=1689143 RepID=UPI0030DA4E3E